MHWHLTKIISKARLMGNRGSMFLFGLMRRRRRRRRTRRWKRDNTSSACRSLVISVAFLTLSTSYSMLGAGTSTLQVPAGVRCRYSRRTELYLGCTLSFHRPISSCCCSVSVLRFYGFSYLIDFTAQIVLVCNRSILTRRHES